MEKLIDGFSDRLKPEYTAANSNVDSNSGENLA